MQKINSDHQIIYKYLIREFTDDHPVLYLYLCGNIRTPKLALQRAINQIKPIFYPAISEEKIISTIKDFLEYKKKQYVNGEIIVKGIY